MSLAADAREAVRARPFVHAGLCAGVLNYAAAATWLIDDPKLDLPDEPEAVATALRRFEADLPEHDRVPTSASVSMRSGVSVASSGDDSDGDVLSIAGIRLERGGSATAIVADGDLDANALAYVLRRLAIDGIEVEAAGIAEGTCLVLVGRREGVSALRTIEDAIEAVPSVVGS
jgi:hypothetical protein